MPSSLNLVMLLLASLVCEAAAQLADAPANLAPDSRMKADILLVVAHPDDETAIGGWLARTIFDLNKKVAVVYLNRGEGGGNSHGLEQAAAMGAVREIEVRRAVAAFGIDLIWFLDGLDTPGQDLFHSLTNWGHGRNLEKVVRLVRLTRPEVIITWLPHYVAGENHGDHQAAGVLAVEAFDSAGDPTCFPAQVAPPRERQDINNFNEGLPPWQPKKLYFFSDASHPLPAAGPAFDLSAVSPSRQVPYYQLASQLHLPHLTQGDVAEVALAATHSGDYRAFVAWMAGFKLIFGKAVVPCRPEDDLFAGITSAPAAWAPPRGYRAPARKGISLAPGGIYSFYRDFWPAHGLDHLAALVAEPEVTINAGGYLHIPLELANATPESAAVELTATCPDGWRQVAGTARYTLAPGEIRPVQTFFFAPDRRSETGERITWSAAVDGKTVGAVTMQVFLADWTLPQ